MRLSTSILTVCLLLVTSARLLPADENAKIPNARKPQTEAEIKYWLENMIGGHHFSLEEVHQATGMSKPSIKEFIKKAGLLG